MGKYDEMFEILKNEYGITTKEQLDAALKKQKRLDISIFCLREGQLPSPKGNGLVKAHGWLA